MGDKKVLDPQDPKKEEKEEIVEKEDGSVEVAVTEAPAETSIEEVIEGVEEELIPPKPKVEERPEEDKSTKEARAMFYQIRELRREIEDLKKSKLPSEKEEKKVEDLEAELAKKPVSTIQEIVDDRVKKALDEDRRKNAYFSTFEKTLEDSKARVLKRHPELEDQASIKSQVMLEILNQKPDLTTNPYGPIIAMNEMEDELERRGYKEKPAPRVATVSSLPQTRVVPQTSKTVTLTKDEIEFCKEHNIDPKIYAQNKLRTSKSAASVEV
jgi:hypothetical protein